MEAFLGKVGFFFFEGPEKEENAARATDIHDWMDTCVCVVHICKLKRCHYSIKANAWVEFLQKNGILELLNTFPFFTITQENRIKIQFWVLMSNHASSVIPLTSIREPTLVCWVDNLQKSEEQNFCIICDVFHDAKTCQRLAPLCQNITKKKQKTTSTCSFPQYNLLFLNTSRQVWLLLTLLSFYVLIWMKNAWKSTNQLQLPDLHDRVLRLGKLIFREALGECDLLAAWQV